MVMKMPIPTPNDGEQEREFISRCTPIMVRDGKSPKQAVAICYGQWREKHPSASPAPIKAENQPEMSQCESMTVEFD